MNMYRSTVTGKAHEDSAKPGHRKTKKTKWTTDRTEADADGSWLEIEWEGDGYLCSHKIETKAVRLPK